MEKNSHPQSQVKKIPILMNFLIGGLSGCLTVCISQPIDTIKVQIQSASECKISKLSPIAITSNYISTNGIKGLYRGLDSAILMQFIYTTSGFGLYYSLNDYFIRKNKGKPASFQQKLFGGFTAGAFAAFFSNPADVVLVRMQADNLLSQERKRNYTSVANGLKRIIKEEGITKLWSGSFPNIARAAVLNMFLIGPFEEIKQKLSGRIHNYKIKSAISSLIACIIGGFACLPFDNVKTKLQKMVHNADGSHPYNGMIDCFIKTIKNEGPLRLWVGLSVLYLRLGPHVVIVFFLNDFFRHLYISNLK